MPVQAHIKEQLQAAPVCHRFGVPIDETGVRVDGKLHWLHRSAGAVASNESYTHLFVHPKRGKDALLSE